MLTRVVLFFLLLSVSVIEGNSRDSYLEAYEASHGTTQRIDREYTESFPYPPGQPGYEYGPPKPVYGPPSAPAGPPQPIYGPPAGPPKPVYGPPSAPAGPLKPIYGPPSAPAHNYGPPIVPIYLPPAPVYGEPHGLLGFLDKLKLKLDLFTIGKILLKIVLFKKFVSFVAILCLLLFIPTLKHKVDEGVPEGGDDDDDLMRGFGQKKYRAGDEVLNNITQFVIGAIDNFSKNYTDEAKCEDFYCTTRKMLKRIDDKLSYKRLAEVYSREV